MKNMILMLGVVTTLSMVFSVSDAEAQGFRRNRAFGLYAGFDYEGMSEVNRNRMLNPARTLSKGARDAYSPRPYYAYSNRGVRAGVTHHWNQDEASTRPWHGDYSYWRWNEPTALVVPPTAAYQSTYAWGVGQTRSTPIHHQFGRRDAGMVGGAGQGQFSNTPYWPSSTDQFGVYPVRAPW